MNVLTLITALSLAQAGLVESRKLELSQLVLQQAKKEMPDDVVELRLSAFKRPQRLPFLVQQQETEVKFKPHERFSGKTVVKIRWRSYTKWVPVEFEQYVMTAVSRKDLRSGHVLKASDMEWKATLNRRLRHATVVTPDHLVGMVLMARVGKGEPLLIHRLRRPVVINRGDRVEILIQGLGVRVRSDGSALASGRVGDVITVARHGCEKKIRAQVTGPGRVNLPF
jgi:flagella basal body P-ring formation protein FlgA